MRTLKEVMGNYLDDSDKSINEISVWMPEVSNGCPISPSPAQWEVVSDPTRFMKKFEFGNFKELQNFLNEVLAFQEQIQHHGKITIDGLGIIIEVYTHDVNDVTEIDQEYVHEVENILRDVQYYSEEDEVYV